MKEFLSFFPRLFKWLLAVVLRGGYFYVADTKRAFRPFKGHTYWKEWQANSIDIFHFNSGRSSLPQTSGWNVISAIVENISAESNIWVQPPLTVVSFCTIVNLSDIETKRAKHETDMYKYGLKESDVMLLTGPLGICQ
jgi:hypothetical protein